MLAPGTEVSVQVEGTAEVEEVAVGTAAAVGEASKLVAEGRTEAGKKMKTSPKTPCRRIPASFLLLLIYASNTPSNLVMV